MEQQTSKLKKDNGGTYYDTRLQKDSELQRLAAAHNCHRGSMCAIKHCSFHWSLSAAGDHVIKFCSAPHTLTLTKTSNHLKVCINCVNHGFLGSVTCYCSRPECLSNAINSICAITGQTE